MSLEASLVRTFLRHAVKHRSRPDAPVSELRKLVDFVASLFPRPSKSVRIESLTLGSRSATALTAAGADPRKVVLYLHGGGYVSGTVTMYLDLAARLSAAAGARVVLLDYRLAPEHPFPAAVDDAVAAYRALLETTSPGALAIAGDSAGGGLTFATLVSLRDAGMPLPCAAWTLSPWTDLTHGGPSITENREADSMIRVELIAPTVAWYLAGTDPEHPLASPLMAPLHELPPVLLHVGSTEVLLDDSRRMAERLRAHGNAAELRIYDDLPHVFHLFAPYVPEARQAIRHGGAFLACHLHAGGRLPGA